MSLKDLVKRRTSPATDTDNPFALLQARMNQMFDDFWSQPMTPLASLGNEFGDFMPRLELSEADKSIEVSAELPGLSDKDVRVTLSETNDSLSIAGEKRFEQERKDENFYRTERTYGSFRRTVALPSPVDPASVEATCKDGVLRIKMGKAPEETRGVRKIAIKRA